MVSEGETGVWQRPGPPGALLCPQLSYRPLKPQVTACSPDELVSTFRTQRSLAQHPGSRTGCCGHRTPGQAAALPAAPASQLEGSGTGLSPHLSSRDTPAHRRCSAQCWPAGHADVQWPDGDKHPGETSPCRGPLAALLGLVQSCVGAASLPFPFLTEPGAASEAQKRGERFGGSRQGAVMTLVLDTELEAPADTQEQVLGAEERGVALLAHRRN